MNDEFDALVLIDLQQDYFPGGRWALPGAAEAGSNAVRLLAGCRVEGLPVFHVRHEAGPQAPFFVAGTPGADFAPGLEPRSGEAVVVKHRPSSFLETDLEERLRGAGAARLLVAGMMSNMCVDAFVRAASDLGFAVTVAHDACAAMPLEFGGVQVSAPQVHAAFMAALGKAYARLAPVAELLPARGVE